jgi:hypothetical protein
MAPIYSAVEPYADTEQTLQQPKHSYFDHDDGFALLHHSLSLSFSIPPNDTIVLHSVMLQSGDLHVCWDGNVNPTSRLSNCCGK